ncbi:hypothetical protein [Bdellovibrio bacteriovorus]|uniref:Uncharacterized protein n=1 Tax=Bdellovibrio bacteriovorus str. Tiberius TaxID=1069642 RepID=K7YMQ6_BDEBC|nr:hypothetical protein [Bdellovibrio bacteriovorus]AFY01091.1 hypothetical protein Bdt_1393 [Bdellovibrio bacteriovorus str. Tiberius]
MKALLVLAISLTLLSFSAHAYRESNGGKGVLTDRGVVLLDLYEASVDQPFFGGSYSEKTYWDLRVNLPKDFPVQLIARKLADLERFSPELHLLLVLSLNDLRWEFTRNELQMTTDLEKLPDVDPAKLVQLAVRKKNQIFIHRPLWNIMSTDQQAALVVHEILYHHFDARSASTVSLPVRKFVGVLFSDRSYSQLMQDPELQHQWRKILLFAN